MQSVQYAHHPQNKHDHERRHAESVRADCQFVALQMLVNPRSQYAIKGIARKQLRTLVDVEDWLDLPPLSKIDLVLLDDFPHSWDVDVVRFERVCAVVESVPREEKDFVTPRMPVEKVGEVVPLSADFPVPVVLTKRVRLTFAKRCSLIEATIFKHPRGFSEQHEALYINCRFTRRFRSSLPSFAPSSFAQRC